MANKLSVAFIGTGIMGAPIAGHILDAGYPVTVNNRTKSKAAALVERGAVWADTPAEAVANADVVFTMVGYPSEVEELYLAGDGLLACTKPGAVLIDLTTRSATSLPPLRPTSAASMAPARARLLSLLTRCRWAPAWSAWPMPWHLPS